MQELKLDILILAHNEETTIRKAIESTIGQGAQKIIFVDDASTDGTAEEAKRALENIPHKFVQSSKNLGIIGASNLAFEESDAEYILRVDGDDELLPRAVETLWNAYKPGTFVSGPYVERTGSNQILRQPQSIYECLACSVLMKADDIRRAGGYAKDNVGIFVEYDLFARLESVGVCPIIVDSEALYVYNRHEGSLTAHNEWVSQSMEKLREIWGSEVSDKIRTY